VRALWIDESGMGGEGMLVVIAQGLHLGRCPRLV
jgi:hypothetical protein